MKILGGSDFMIKYITLLIEKRKLKAKVKEKDRKLKQLAKEQKQLDEEKKDLRERKELYDKCAEISRLSLDMEEKMVGIAIRDRLDPQANFDTGTCNSLLDESVTSLIRAMALIQTIEDNC